MQFLVSRDMPTEICLGLTELRADSCCGAEMRAVIAIVAVVLALAVVEVTSHALSALMNHRPSRRATSRLWPAVVERPISANRTPTPSSQASLSCSRSTSVFVSTNFH